MFLSLPLSFLASDKVDILCCNLIQLKIQFIRSFSRINQSWTINFSCSSSWKFSSTSWISWSSMTRVILSHHAHTFLGLASMVSGSTSWSNPVRSDSSTCKVHTQEMWDGRRQASLASGWKIPLSLLSCRFTANFVLYCRKLHENVWICGCRLIFFHRKMKIYCILGNKLSHNNVEHVLLKFTHYLSVVLTF